MENCKYLKMALGLHEDGFVSYKVIKESNGSITFQIFEMNEVYEKISCLKALECAGKSILEINNDNDHIDFNLSEELNNLVKNRSDIFIEKYIKSLKKWYSIKLRLLSEELVGVFFRDITKQKLFDFEIMKKIDFEQLKEVYGDEYNITMELSDINLAAVKLKESESRLIKAQKIAKVGNWELDISRNLIWASGVALEIYGLGSEEGVVPYELIKQLAVGEDRSKLDMEMQKLVRENGDYGVKYSIRRADDQEIRYIHSYGEVDYNPSGIATRVTGVIRDITDLVENENKLEQSYKELNTLYHNLENSEHELRNRYEELLKHKELLQLSEQRYKTLVENSKDAIYSIDCEGKFITVNKKLTEEVGLTEAELIGKTMAVITDNEIFLREWEAVIKKIIDTKETQYIENWRDENTAFSVTLSPIMNADHCVIGITGTNHDISEIKRNEQLIMKMAYYDDLTNLPNRLMLADRLKKGISSAKRKKNRLAILFIDMDNFKRVNDTLGHAIGDELLKEASKRLIQSVREGDTVARISGDEFALMINDIESIEKTIPLLDRIVGSFTEPFFISNRLINMTASIGISVYPDDGDQVEDLLRSSDTAMYKSKELGKNRYQFFNISMKKELIKKLNIEGMLSKALTFNEFVLYYQPQINAISGKLRGFEALIRWNNPEMGFLMPNDFIAIAEEVGLIASIGEWVLNRACEFNCRINKVHGTNHIIAVNISPLQLKQRDFYEVVVKAIYSSGINPENLELEVTENIFIDNFDFAVKLLKDLRNLGVRIALDDFGTGYSSLSYLKKLPINLLKIDKTFVREINDDNNDNDLTGPIISIAHNLNIETLAEGVEEKFQLDFLVNAECDNIQGYYFGKPVSEDELVNGKEMCDLFRN